MTQNSTPAAGPRFVVTETRHGYQVKDTRSGTPWGKHYRAPGWAIRAAVKLNDTYKGW